MMAPVRLPRAFSWQSGEAEHKCTTNMTCSRRTESHPRRNAPVRAREGPQHRTFDLLRSDLPCYDCRTVSHALIVPTWSKCSRVRIGQPTCGLIRRATRSTSQHRSTSRISKPGSSVRSQTVTSSQPTTSPPRRRSHASTRCKRT